MALKTSIGVATTSSTYSTDSKGWHVTHLLGSHLEQMGVCMQFVGRDIMRTYVNNLMQLTYPKKVGEAKRAIAKDLSMLYATLDQPEVLEYFNAQFGDGSASRGGVLKGSKRKTSARRELRGVYFNWQGDQSAMKAWHKKFRQAGRVKRERRVVATVGDWRFGNEMYVPRSALRKYQASVFKNIGIYKAGWQSAVEYFARTTAGRMVLPAFVKAQSLKRGTYEDRFKKDGSGYASATNLVPYADKQTKHVLLYAQGKLKAYEKKATAKQIGKILERFNRVKGQQALPPLELWSVS